MFFIHFLSITNGIRSTILSVVYFETMPARLTKRRCAQAGWAVLNESESVAFLLNCAKCFNIKQFHRVLGYLNWLLEMGQMSF